MDKILRWVPVKSLGPKISGTFRSSTRWVKKSGAFTPVTGLWVKKPVSDIIIFRAEQNRNFIKTRYFFEDESTTALPFPVYSSAISKGNKQGWAAVRGGW